ncbi:DUF5677 domain-containing protein [Georgenia satyanarayanai]|uniref:DUF5677 domain-containing protein n=1 Tax=Georgenia satyanarayanai TaxID=860221 RepID=UPI0020425867|nr:DUF5677 domain-containing protein [Georgenia satyanarayanai]MCM3662379.1 DUF5677 domain-containing protein [Georgenia satyanarayanai]
MAKQQHVEKSGPMAGHVRRGRLFVPEFAATVQLTPNDWFRDDVPDYLWPLMIAESQGNSSLIRFARWQGAVQADLKDLVPAKALAAGLDGRLTSLDRLVALHDGAADVMRERAVEYYLLTDEISKALSTYPERPAAWLTERELASPDQDDVDLIAASLFGVLRDGHREALIKCLLIWSAVQAGTFTSDQHTIDLLKNYPNDEATRPQADTTVRASWGAMKGLLQHEDEKYFDDSIRWARVFWGMNSMTTMCRRKRELEGPSDGLDEESEAATVEDEEGERPANGPAATSIEDVDPHGEHDFRQTAMDLMSSYVEAIETSPQQLYDQERQEVHTGLVSRAAREVIAVLGAPDLWCLEHGAHIGRMLVETRIQLAWMAAQDPSIYPAYQDYGAGKAKLYARILEDLPEGWHGSNEAIKESVEEGVAEFDRLSHTGSVFDVRSVDTRSTFASGKTLRDMAAEVGLSDLYRNSFQLQSGIVHGEWWSIEAHGMERCLNVMHRAHLIPSLSLSSGDDKTLARSWLSGLYTIIRMSLSILGTKEESVDAAFSWLEGEGDEPEDDAR